MSKLALLGGKKVREKPFVNNAIIGKEERKRVNDVLEDRKSTRLNSSH